MSNWKVITQYRCGCQIREIRLPTNPKHLSIEWCPKHDAASDMYEALKDLADCFRNIEILGSIQNEGEKYSLEIAISTMTKALAKAEGRQ